MNFKIVYVRYLSANLNKTKKSVNSNKIKNLQREKIATFTCRLIVILKVDVTWIISSSEYACAFYVGTVYMQKKIQVFFLQMISHTFEILFHFLCLNQSEKYTCFHFLYRVILRDSMFRDHGNRLNSQQHKFRNSRDCLYFLSNSIQLKLKNTFINFRFGKNINNLYKIFISY